MEKIIDVFGLRHGIKSIEEANREGEQTFAGLDQGWCGCCQVIKLVGRDKLRNAEIISSPVWRVEQLAILIALAAGRDPRTPESFEKDPKAEWGPGLPFHTDYFISRIWNCTKDVFILCGHDGNLEALLRQLLPALPNHKIGRGEGFYLKLRLMKSDERATFGLLHYSKITSTLTESMREYIFSSTNL